MNEHLGTILAGVGAAFSMVGGLLVWLTKASTTGEREARTETVGVLKESAKEHAAEAARNRDVEGARNQKVLDGLASNTAALAALKEQLAALTRAFEQRGNSGRSGQMSAVRLDDKERR